MGGLFSKGSKSQKKPESRVTDQDRAILVGITQKGVQNNFENIPRSESGAFFLQFV